MAGLQNGENFIHGMQYGDLKLKVHLEFDC